MVRCGTCVNFEQHEKKGKLTTSLGCIHWHVDLGKLSLNLRRSIILISKLRYLTPDIFDMFYKYWNDIAITATFTNKFHRYRNFRCKHCVYFETCAAKGDSRPQEYDCTEWSYDISRKRFNIQCPSMLRRLLNLTDTLGRNDFKYIDVFLDRYAKLSPLTYLTANVKVTFKGKQYNARVIDITKEHIVLRLSTNARVLLLPESWEAVQHNA